MGLVPKFVFFLAAMALLPMVAQAGDFSRPGWYAGLNYAQGFNFITEAIDLKSGGKLNTKDTWGLNGRGGYRLLTWLAIEGNYEYMDNFKTDGPLGSSDIRAGTITIGPKFLLPFWRVQPYLLLGLGAQFSHLDFTSDTPLLVDDGSTSGWNTALRPALGIDFYISQHLAAILELGAVFVQGKFEDESISISDPIYLSLGAGLQYRF